MTVTQTAPRETTDSGGLESIVAAGIADAAKMRPMSDETASQVVRIISPAIQQASSQNGGTR